MKLNATTRLVYERLVRDLPARPDYLPYHLSLDEPVPVPRIELHLLVNGLRELLLADELTGPEAAIEHELGVLDAAPGDVVLVYADEEQLQRFGRLIHATGLSGRYRFLGMPEGVRLETLNRAQAQAMIDRLRRLFGFR